MVRITSVNWTGMVVPISKKYVFFHLQPIVENCDEISCLRCRTILTDIDNIKKDWNLYLTSQAVMGVVILTHQDLFYAGKIILSTFFSKRLR